MQIILVCGGRDYGNRGCVERVLNGIGPAYILQGGARGADRLAKEYARTHGLPCIEVEANWDYYKKAAGPIRNQWMVELRPDLVVAFPGGRGTADMVDRARSNGVEVVEVLDE